MIFLGCLFNKNEENEILKNSKNGLSNAANTFQWNLIDGLKNKCKDIKIINVLPVGTYPQYYKKILLKNKMWNHENNENIEIGSINLPIIKQHQRYKKIKKVLLNSKENEILIYSTYLPFLKAIYKLPKSYKITLIVTDLPKYYDLTTTNVFKKIIREIYNVNINKYIKRIDKFVLLTEQMKTELKINKKPYIVIEGMCNNINKTQNSKNITNNNNERIILYTGTLNYKYGISNLIKSFSYIPNSNYKLWICGSGEAEKEIIEAQNNDKRIKYYGFLPKNEIIKLQNKSTILINPRQNEGEYTKYSFPSKTIEYLQSGKPIIMYKLDGIPNEYDQYIYYVEGNTIKELAAKIIQVCEQSNEELYKFGEKAKKWIISEKNNIKQADKILNFIKN